MKPITVRTATPADLDAVLAIEQQSFSVPWSREAFASAQASELITILTAELHGCVVGFGCISVLAPEAEILNIAVLPEHRGMGIGRLLLSHMIRRAVDLGADTAYLEVRASNTPARSLYEASGFIPLGIRKNYYEKPTEDAVIMQKSPLTDILLPDVGSTHIK